MRSMTSSWLGMLSLLESYGHDVCPRGMATKELLGQSIHIDMNLPILHVKERELSTAFLCAEPAWILSGDNRLETIKPYATMFERFSDDGVFMSGAYGPPLVDQLPYVVQSLKNDPFSRQAIVNIWRNKPAKSSDTPCTLSYQFFIRNNQLHMVANMRSNDIWLGTSYDVFTQTMIAYAICLLLQEEYPNLIMGNLTLNVGSMHYYDRDIDKIQEVLRKEIAAEDIVTSGLEYDYSITFEYLKEYLSKCAKTLLNKQPVEEGFLKGLQPKGSWPLWK